jgi:hypothetical protein
VPAHRVRQDLVEEGDPGHGQEDHRDEKAADQAGKCDARPAYKSTGTEQGTEHEDSQDRHHDPAAAAETVVDRQSGVQADGTGPEHGHRPDAGRGPSPRRQHEGGADAAEREAHPPDPALDVAELAEHRLAPLGPLRGQQADRPAHQAQRRVLRRAVQEPARIPPVPRNENS